MPIDVEMPKNNAKQGINILCASQWTAPTKDYILAASDFGASEKGCGS